MNLFGPGWSTETGFELGDENCVGTERLDLVGKGFIEPLNDRDHKDYGDYTYTNAKNRERRAKLICPQSIKGHQSRFFYVVDSDCHQKVRTLNYHPGPKDQGLHLLIPL